MEGSTILVIVTVMLLSSSLSSVSSANNNNQFIITSCKATTYPKLCFSSLSARASDFQTSPKLMAGTALSVALDSARTTSAMIVKLSQTQGLKPREVSAMRDCVEEMSDSVEEMERSIGEMKERNKGSNYEEMISDVQTWVSAALTDENTCMDGFGGKVMNGSVKNAVRGKIVNIAQLTSNALALVNRFAALQG